MTRTVVLCVGNEFAGDDGVALRVARIIEPLVPIGVQIITRADLGLDALEAFLDTQRVILVDATVSGLPPGTCHRLSAAQFPQGGTGSVGHQTSITALLAIAGILCKGAPPETTLIGIEAESLEPFSTDLSPTVQAAVPGAVAMVLGELGASDEQVFEGRRRAQQLTTW